MSAEDHAAENRSQLWPNLVITLPRGLQQVPTYPQTHHTTPIVDNFYATPKPGLFDSLRLHTLNEKNEFP